MLTRGEDVEAHALRKRGWSISAIARHLGRDRKTVRSYLNGERVPGTRVRPDTPDPLADYEKYLVARFTDDHHVWGTVLFEEVTALGYAQSYPTFVRQIRTRGLRPHCEACTGVKGRDTIEIDHPPGEEIQWDWFERRRAPWGGTAYVLLGTLPHSSRTRGMLAESMDQAHLVEAMDGVLRRLGGTAGIWRTDRLATVIRPGTKDVQASFAPVAKHYGAIVEPCPPRRGNRKGAVEAAVRFTSGRWWRTLSATSPEEAQASLDRFLAGAGDARKRRTPQRCEDDRRRTGRRRAAARPARTPVPSDGHRRPPGGRQRHGRLPGQPLLGATGTVRGHPRAAPSAGVFDPQRPRRFGGAARHPPAGTGRGRDHRADPRAPGSSRVGDPVELHHHPPV